MSLLLLAAALKLVSEIALLALLGQAVLGWLIGPQRSHNAVYRLLQVLTAPFVRAAGWLAPAFAARLAVVALLLLWLAATLLKIRLCLVLGVQACR